MEQNVKILPQWQKDRICLLYEQHIEWIEERIQDPTIEYSGENQIDGHPSRHDGIQRQTAGYRLE